MTLFSYSYVGIIRIRFYGYDLSLSAPPSDDLLLQRYDLSMA
jgi:hypothetical protein